MLYFLLGTRYSLNNRNKVPSPHELVFKYTLEMIQPTMIYGKMFYKLLCSTNVIPMIMVIALIASIIKYYIQSQVLKIYNRFLAWIGCKEKTKHLKMGRTDLATLSDFPEQLVVLFSGMYNVRNVICRRLVRAWYWQGGRLGRTSPCAPKKTPI